MKPTWEQIHNSHQAAENGPADLSPAQRALAWTTTAISDLTG
ncbi:hypothetical protein [Amycolatopsis benzoatilytica]|nr:hypothetical protein [Amycolatopsis benzoatilytica]